MVKIIGIVLNENQYLVGYIVENDGDIFLYSKKTIIDEAKYHSIKNCYIREEVIDGVLNKFIDLNEEGLSIVIKEKEALQKYGPIR